MQKSIDLMELSKRFYCSFGFYGLHMIISKRKLAPAGAKSAASDACLPCNKSASEQTMALA
jgi:hypothetical protein